MNPKGAPKPISPITSYARYLQFCQLVSDNEKVRGSLLGPGSEVQSFLFARKVAGNSVDPFFDLDVEERLHLPDVGKAILSLSQYSCSVPIAEIKPAYRSCHELSHAGVLFPILDVEQILRLAKATRDVCLCLVCMSPINIRQRRARADEQHCRRDTNNRS